MGQKNICKKRAHAYSLSHITLRTLSYYSKTRITGRCITAVTD